MLHVIHAFFKHVSIIGGQGGCAFEVRSEPLFAYHFRPFGARGSTPVAADSKTFERGRRNSKRANETRKQLLDTAARLFADRGYHAVSVPEIVKVAGVGHGTFYEYF